MRECHVVQADFPLPPFFAQNIANNGPLLRLS